MHRRQRLALFALLSFAAGCEDGQAPLAPKPLALTPAWSTAAADTTGDLIVTTNTVGISPDRDGYTVSVDSGPVQSIGVNDTVTFTGLAAGDHSVALSGLAENCGISGNGPNPQTVTVPAGGSATASFSVGCPRPTWGYLVVKATTIGLELDPDGYTVTATNEGSTSRSIGTNGSVIFRLPIGLWSIQLSGVAANCLVAGANPRSVFVPAYPDTSVTEFPVACSPTKP